LLKCNATAERDAALLMAERLAGNGRVTTGADNGYDTRDFVRELRGMNITPHVAQNENRSGGSAIDVRTTRHAGYKTSQVRRKRVEGEHRFRDEAEHFQAGPGIAFGFAGMISTGR
jgi:hypothetical protein